MSWSSIKSPLPCRAWMVISPTGRMVINPVESREAAERMAAWNVSASLRTAIRMGYRVVEVEIAEVPTAKTS